MDCAFKDLIAVSKDGEWGKGEPFDDSVEMLAIRGTDFEDIRFGLTVGTPRRHIAKRHAERKILRPWDLIIEVAGGTKNQITGRTVLLRPHLFSRSELPFTCASFSRFIRLNTELCDPAFMFWYLQHLYSSGSMHAYHTQHTGIARFQWTTFSEREPLTLPPLPVQQRIAGILSAYDELIENSQRRIKILEQMARGLYREWFVHFRFPGHEGHPRVASAVGEIPAGWEVVDLASVCIEGNGIQTGPFGSQLHAYDYSYEGVPVVMPKDIIGFRIQTDSIARIPEETADRLARHRMQPGDIVYGRRGDIGRRAYVMPHQAGWLCGSGSLRFRPDSRVVNGWYLFNYLGQDDVVGLIAGRAQGVTMPNLSAGVMASVPVTLPPRYIQDRFEHLTFPLAEAREILTDRIENLRRTRDLLLPRLLAGQVELAEVDE
mgnify:CR=1 FL=1